MSPSRLARLLLSVAVAAAACAALAGQPHAAGPAAYRVIVNPSNPTASVERRFLADVFLKKATRWGDGEVVRPVDLTPDAPPRQRFSEEIVGRTVSAVKNYWQQQVFSGRDVPPPELDSDEDVVRFVLRYPAAVGYVSGSANLDRVKVLSVR
jgi:ABC-type phosphate transport system substrate-binding protein